MLSQVVHIFSDFLSYNTQQPLLFTHVSFWLFFLALSVGYLACLRKFCARAVYLLLFSLFFYYKTCGAFFVLILFSILFNYLMGGAIGLLRTRWKRRLVLLGAVSLNLALLGFFKYMPFLLGEVNRLLGTDWEATNALSGALASLFGDDPTLEDAILPVGISFYTFQAISYVVDIYRGDLKPLARLSDFGFYLSFFPQLVAGPIVRASEFIPQLTKPYHLSKREGSHALFLILGGLFKKVVLSDYIAINFVDRVFDNPVACSGVENLFAVYGYAMQIYCDFSGYTDIAIGVALLLGFRLTINFNFPYRAHSLTDFWRRWHISLSTWLRDYLYIPLGGSRHGVGVMFFALFATMLLGGLWHGAAWTFVIWGGAHGLGLVISKLVDRLPGALRQRSLFRYVRAFVTFHIVCALWVFFRCSTLFGAYEVFGRIFYDFRPSLILDVVEGYARPIALIALGYLLHWLPFQVVESVRGAFISSPLWVRFALSFLLVLLFLNVQQAGMQPFIYFNF